MALAADAVGRCINTSAEPAEAALKGGPSLWFVISCLRAYGGDLEAVARELDVPMEAVEAALVYYSQHQPAIDARIALNQA